MPDPTEIENWPEYESPPVIETVLGVQFDRLPGLKNAHLGAFWKTMDPSEWPAVNDGPPLQSMFEEFTESASWAKGLQLQITQDPSSRLMIKSQDQIRMIQLQNGRLHFNWLGQTGARYPHYGNVRKGFISALELFVKFIAQEKLGDIHPNQWEVTYLNHIPKGTVWNDPKDWGFFRPLAAVPSVQGLVEGESFGGGWSFVIPENRGRLHVQWQHGKRGETGEQEIIVLNFTARGPVSEGGDRVQAILEGVDLGRATIVKSFSKFMTDEANRYWGLKHAGN